LNHIYPIAIKSMNILKKEKTRNDLLFRAVSRQVPSAQKDLTAVFGMGTGVAPLL
jgi:hypothetical protein